MVIIKGVDEPENDDAEELPEAQRIVTMCFEESAEAPEVVEVERVGKNVDGRPRLLKVHFKHSGEQRKVLKNAKNLKEQEETKGKIFIRPSYTYAQRQRIKTLYDLRDEYESKDGEGSWFVKHDGSDPESWKVEKASAKPRSSNRR